jgi:hypothetical protein
LVCKHKALSQTPILPSKLKEKERRERDREKERERQKKEKKRKSKEFPHLLYVLEIAYCRDPSFAIG